VQTVVHGYSINRVSAARSVLGRRCQGGVPGYSLPPYSSDVWLCHWLSYCRSALRSNCIFLSRSWDPLWGSVRACTVVPHSRVQLWKEMMANHNEGLVVVVGRLS